MIRRVLVGACLLLGCVGSAAPAVTPVEIPEPRGNEPPVAEPETSVSAVDEVLALVEAAKLDLDRFYDDDERALTEAGLTPALATAALEELAGRCKDRRTPTCGHSGQEKLLREALSQWARGRLGLSSAPVLLRLSHFGDWEAGWALDDALTRRMQATLGPCAAPTEADVAAVRAELTSFVVLDHRRGKLEGRAAAATELDDLAYFLAAVADNGEPPGGPVDTLRSGVTLTEEEVAQREQRLTVFEHATAHGDAALTVQAGSDYLHMLGYPGPIDLSREVEMNWGGAVFSYVMRDVALAAELDGQPELSAALYRRANPGGGACGTSVSSRRADQLQGLIRSEEARGRCQAVVAERLINTEGKSDSPYGPARLAEAGYDLERLYRGALVTRHRDREPAEVEAAIGRAPAGGREAGLARLAAQGPEAWELRVWATEGLAAEVGRPGVERLLTLVDHADPELRARMISAIGDGAERPFLGSCPKDGGMWLTLRGSSMWSRNVPKFGEDCATWLTDDEAREMARRLLPHLRGDDPGVRTATAEALGLMAAPGVRRSLRRAMTRAESEHARCEARDGDECWRYRDVVDAAREALETLAKAEQNATQDPLAGLGEGEDGVGDEARAQG